MKRLKDHFVFDDVDINQLKNASEEVFSLIIKTVRHICDNNLHTNFGVPNYVIDSINHSIGDIGFLGRFDWAYNGINLPKLLEYNGDTPVMLDETISNTIRGIDIRQNLTHYLNKIQEFCSINNSPLHLIYQEVDGEDVINHLKAIESLYPEECIFLKIEDLGKTDEDEFVDLDNYLVKCMIKLYSWSWLIRDGETDFGKAFLKRIDNGDIKCIEPIWKVLTNDKRFLSLMWELNPNHPNLLKTVNDNSTLSGKVVAKPIIGREGQNINIAYIDDNVDIIASSVGDFSDEGFIYQEYGPVANTRYGHAVVSTWMVEDKFSGIVIREDGLITTKNARIVPYFS